MQEEKKKKYNGLHGFHIFNIQMLIWLSPRALLGFKFFTTLKKSSSVKFIVFNNSFVLRNSWVDKLLLVSI